VPMSPETAVAPLQQAPPDRPTRRLEDWAREGLALLFGDRRLDDNERQVLREFMEEVALRAANGGVGNGGTPAAGAEPAMPPPGAGDMNQNVEDMGAVEGAVPEEAY